MSSLFGAHVFASSSSFLDALVNFSSLSRRVLIFLVSLSALTLFHSSQTLSLIASKYSFFIFSLCIFFSAMTLWFLVFQMNHIVCVHMSLITVVSSFCVLCIEPTFSKLQRVSSWSEFKKWIACNDIWLRCYWFFLTCGQACDHRIFLGHRYSVEICFFKPSN